jgi:superfamily II DNA or RNA helicase
MARLEELTPPAAVKGVLPDRLVTVVAAKWFGSDVLELTYKDPAGNLGHQLIYRDGEPTLEIATVGRPWSFDGDGGLLRLVSEAYRIKLAYLFDPHLAVHTSLVEPLPHQITAVYGEMLTRQPLRFLLADDPGAGKTIMAGLLIKELRIRGDVQRCLVVCPGSLAVQWQDELWRRFGLDFKILTNDALEAARSGNWFEETPLAIARLDKLSRNEDVQAKLATTQWDLVIADEAHKMSATYFGGEVKYTKRYRLGQLLGGITRHLLLMTATPHNGKEADFQLFMALLDGDRFEGKFRDGVHTSDASDLMRRMVKEDLLKFDGTPLFPERIAYTVSYGLSDEEAALYQQVTAYVREEFNRADALQNEGRKGTVGFALTILQRRLASSPEAIYQSLRRRRERLEKRMRDERLERRGWDAALDVFRGLPVITPDDVDDLEDAPEEEVEETEQQLIDQATAARTLRELEIEIEMLKRLEALAQRVRQSGKDSKWRELANLLSEIFTPEAVVHRVAEERAPYGAGPIPPPTPSPRQKLVIFTEHRDTLNYLADRIRTLLGLPESVVTIHGGMGREQRRNAQESFLNDPLVRVLVATDAAGEGINLQRAHLMINYDLPWNPNRLEQRFGRIHRIGQTEVCHLWNLVAEETREGDVYLTLLRKMEEEREALGGKVFDVLGKLTFENRPLRELLVEAICGGALPEEIPRADVDAACEAFCLCRVPQGTDEQKQLGHLLLGIDREFSPPRFGGFDEDPLSMRAVTWRFVLELVARSPDESLAGLGLVARLLRPDLLDAPLSPALRASLFAWRWVAARTMLEWGWTVLFERALNVLRGARQGMDRAELRGALEDFYDRDSNESLSDVARAAEGACEDGPWLAARLRSRRPADLLKSMCAGVYAARRDQARLHLGPPAVLAELWGKGPVAFEAIHRSLEDRLSEGSPAAVLWAQWGEDSVAQHVRNSLQKMRSGDNPDSLLCDYDGGVWRVPGKVGNARPNPAGAGSRLDIALAWARQLGLIAVDSEGGLSLTGAGEAYRARWDEEHG